MRIVILFICFLFNLNYLAQVDAKEPQLSVEETRALQDFAVHRIGLNPISKKYLLDILYIGIPEEEFIKGFTWDESFEGTVRPYITKSKNGVYYIRVPYTKAINQALGTVNGENKRITFKNGELVKYESQYRAQPPFMFLVYSDDTYLLKVKEKFSE